MSAPFVIIIDWGTSAFRAWLVQAETGVVQAEIPAGKGMRDLDRAEFPAYCRSVLAPWHERAPDAPIYMAGMVGAPAGWVRAPQPALPVDLSALARDTIPAPGLAGAYVIPGVRLQDDGADRHDVMRGEEVQIFGALALAGQHSGVLCLPGTHSKWARVESGLMTDFTTAITGEMYQAILEGTVVGRPADRTAPWSADAFKAGVAIARTEGGLLDQVFNARSRHLYAGLGVDQMASYISGILVGHEIRSLKDRYLSEKPILLVGSDALRPGYEAAFALFGLPYQWIGAREATLAGVLALLPQHQATVRALV